MTSIIVADRRGQDWFCRFVTEDVTEYGRGGDLDSEVP